MFSCFPLLSPVLPGAWLQSRILSALQHAEVWRHTLTSLAFVELVEALLCSEVCVVCSVPRRGNMAHPHQHASAGSHPLPSPLAFCLSAARAKVCSAGSVGAGSSVHLGKEPQHRCRRLLVLARSVEWRGTGALSCNEKQKKGSAGKLCSSVRAVVPHCAAQMRHCSPPPLPRSLSSQIVHLVRHGQGYHNVEAALKGPAAYKDPKLMDARLDETGKAQAIALGMQARRANISIDIVLVSPLTRTLETATYAFAWPPSGAGLAGGAGAAAAAAGGGGAAPRLTLEGEEELAPSGPAPPFLAVELVREAFGSHPCDQRRRVSELRKEFPHVDFSLVGTDEDTWHNPDKRETVRDVANRADKFLAFLSSRPEKNILVVSHGVFLETLLNRSGLLCPEADMKLKRFENAEMRSFVIGGWA